MDDKTKIWSWLHDILSFMAKEVTHLILNRLMRQSHLAPFFPLEQAPGCAPEQSWLGLKFQYFFTIFFFTIGINIINTLSSATSHDIIELRIRHNWLEFVLRRLERLNPESRVVYLPIPSPTDNCLARLEKLSTSCQRLSLSLFQVEP